MTEPVESLRTLVDGPPWPPEPVAELHRRVEARRRRRTRRRAVLAAMAAVLAVVAVVPLLDRPSPSPSQVLAGPGPTPAPATEVVPGPGPPADPGSGATTPTTPLEFVAGEPVRSRIDLPVPEGWQTLSVDTDRRLVGTRPLSEADRALAVLARADLGFTAFPADGVVVAVGYDPLQAKYGTDWDGTPIDNGPPLALGAERTLPGGVRVRRGDVPQSIMRIASYAGPAAPAARLREAEAIVAGITRVRTGDPSVRPSPPPVGSRPGLPGGPLPVAEEGLPEVARTGTGPSALVVVAGSDCAYVRQADAQTFLPTHQPLGGACGTRPAGAAVDAVGSPVLLMGGPGAPPATAVIIRAGPGVRSVSARLVDGRSVPAVLGADGWGVAVGDGRIVGITAIDAAGRRSPETLVR